MPTTNLDRRCRVVAIRGRGSAGTSPPWTEDRGAPATSPAAGRGPAGIHRRSGCVYKEQKPEVTSPCVEPVVYI
jgi:hypothetical protein